MIVYSEETSSWMKTLMMQRGFFALLTEILQGEMVFHDGAALVALPRSTHVTEI